MKILAHFATVAVLTFALAGSAAFAQGKPRGAKKTDPQKIVQLYAGKTSNWNRGGHAYWGSDGSYLGIGRDPSWIGVGKWYVTTRGRLCAEATWTGMPEGKLETSDYEACWEFVTAPDGQIWERYLPEKSDWYRHKPEKQVNGHTQRRKINALRKKYGV